MANRYRNIQVTTTSDGVRYFKNPIYPDIPVSEDDLYVITAQTDRLDLLALTYYGDSSLWWIISSVNPETRQSLYLRPGLQIRIPANKDLALSLYNRANKIR